MKWIYCKLPVLEKSPISVLVIRCCYGWRYVVIILSLLLLLISRGLTVVDEEQRKYTAARGRECERECATLKVANNKLSYNVSAC